MIKNKRILTLLIGLSFSSITCVFFGECYAYSKAHYLGYVQAITDEVLPERKIINTKLRKRSLELVIDGQPLDLETEQILLARLKKTQFFDEVKIVFPQKSEGQKKAEVSEESSSPRTVYEALPSGTIYHAPIADPKWPRFSAGYQIPFKNTFGNKIFNLSFGENLALMRARNHDYTYEIGIQAGLTGLMDVSSEPTRLINSDYFVGLGLSTVHAQHWQNLLQISHLSSHIGDELLIANPSLTQKRINLSYETLKWFTAYAFKSIRPYLTFAYMINRDPSYIKPLSFEIGCDYISQDKFLFDTTRYVFGIHGRFWQQNHYKPTLTIRTGLQLENPIWRERFLQFLIDYGNGPSNHGQFFTKKEHYIGIMVALAN